MARGKLHAVVREGGKPPKKASKAQRKAAATAKRLATNAAKKASQAQARLEQCPAESDATVDSGPPSPQTPAYAEGSAPVSPHTAQF